MKRIIGTVVALAAVLAFSTASSAAPIVFNVSGTGIGEHRQPVRSEPAGVLHHAARATGSPVTVDITGRRRDADGGHPVHERQHADSALSAPSTTDVERRQSPVATRRALGRQHPLVHRRRPRSPRPARSSARARSAASSVCIRGRRTTRSASLARAHRRDVAVNPSSAGRLGSRRDLTTILGSNRSVITARRSEPAPGSGSAGAVVPVRLGRSRRVPEPGDARAGCCSASVLSRCAAARPDRAIEAKSEKRGWRRESPPPLALKRAATGRLP